ncbi:MAG: DUF115 domain-containing protein [Spirochaetes bacterium]|nr:DUF115 domain-containing protein [Spirochaetota bacterium]
MFYQKNLIIIQQNLKDLYNVLVSKENSSSFSHFDVKSKNLNENIISAFNKFFKDKKINILPIKEKEIYLILEEYFLIFIFENINLFFDKYLIFFFDDLEFFRQILEYYSFEKVNFNKWLFVFPFIKLDTISNYLNFFLSIDEFSIEKEIDFLYECFYFFPIFDKEKNRILLDLIIDSVNCFDEESKNNTSNGITNLNFTKFLKNKNFINFFSLFLHFNIQNNFNLENIYIDKKTLKNSYFEKFFIVVEFIRLLLNKFSDKKTYEILIKQQLINLLNNLFFIKKSIKNFPINRPFSKAFVFGAGYSINNINFDILSNIQKNGVAIIVVDTVYKYFLKKGINPDFVIVLDSQKLNYYDFINLPYKKLNLKNKKNEIFIIEISSIYKISLKFKNNLKIYFSSVVKDVNNTWAAINPLSYLIIKETNLSRIPAYGNVSLLAIVFALLFFEEVYVYGFDSGFQKYIYHCKETLDYNYNLFKSNFINTLVGQLTKFCLKKKDSKNTKSSFELLKNRNLFETEFYSYRNRIYFDEDFILNSINYINENFNNNSFKIDKKYNKNIFIKNYITDLEKNSFNNLKNKIKELKEEIKNINIERKNDVEYLINYIRKLYRENELFSKIVYSLFYFNNKKRNLEEINLKDIKLIQKIINIYFI